MTVEAAQITRCDRCGIQHIGCYTDVQHEPFTPRDWLLLDWQQARDGDADATADPCVYTFAFCPSCASEFVEFAAQSKGGPHPQLTVVAAAADGE